MKKLFLIVYFLSIFWSIFSQDSLVYRLETFGSTATADFTPFWIVNNTYGIVPIHSNNAYLRGGVFWDYGLNKDFKIDVGVDLVGASHHSSSFFVQQLYGEIAYKALHLSLGSKEHYNSMLDKNLSSGDFNFSTNARPIPEINLSIPEFTKVPYMKGILQFRGDFAVGKSTDNSYTMQTKSSDAEYTLDVLWHHKSVFFLIEDPTLRFPFSLTLGLDHGVQWGGWTTFDNIGELPHSFDDFIRIVLGKGGGENSSTGDQVNVLGNHQGTYNLKIGYRASNINLAVYKQHYFDDNSGMEYANWRDGIWGLECTLFNQNYIKKVVVESINTTNQSGPFHMLPYTGENARGGGNDDYYNHDYYFSGWSHWGRSLGSPLMTSPEYNNNGKLCFQNNRVKAIHLGLEGNIAGDLSYRALFTGMNAWGRMSYPFLKKGTDFSSLLECSYSCPKWKGWKAGLQLALDQGSLYGDNFGCSLKISKSGIIRF